MAHGHNSGHGGARDGAGRKPIAPKTIMKSVKLTPELWQRAKDIGDGNAAAGIRRALSGVQGGEE